MCPRTTRRWNIIKETVFDMHSLGGKEFVLCAVALAALEPTKQSSMSGLEDEEAFAWGTHVHLRYPVEIST